MQENNPKIFVVIVFFHPSDEQVENARRIGRCYHTVVVDNSPEAIYSLGDEGLTYIPLLENKGIAFAQNRGIEYALSQGAEYIVTFDQDSKPQEDFVPCLMQQFVSIKKGTDNLMVVGPMIIDETTGVAYKHNLGDRDEQKVTTVISSGMLASKEAFAEAGLFEEKMFIDLVDHEWCFRLASVGGAIYMTRKVQLQHKVGDSTHRLLGIQMLSATPFRYYYKVRNTLWLLRRSYPPKGWKVKSAIRLMGTTVYYFITALYDRHSKEVYANIRRGIRDGFRERAFT